MSRGFCLRAVATHCLVFWDHLSWSLRAKAPAPKLKVFDHLNHENSKSLIPQPLAWESHVLAHGKFLENEWLKECNINQLTQSNPTQSNPTRPDPTHSNPILCTPTQPNSIQPNPMHTNPCFKPSLTCDAFQVPFLWLQHLLCSWSSRILREKHHTE
jgi:hypothetical protein